MSGSYYGSYPNWRIFRKFAILVIWGINNLGFFLRYIPWDKRVNGERRSLGLII